MTPYERYAFDLRGFVVRRRALDRREVAELTAAVDALGLPPPASDLRSQRFDGFLPRHRAFAELVDHPSVIDVVLELCGPFVRLDHAYGLHMAPETSGLGLHGGGTPFDPAQFYVVHGGSIACGLVAVQFALCDMPAGHGFMCVPGSHRAAFRLPAGLGPDDPLVEDVALEAGDALVFTEALTHGTRPWPGPGRRLALFYKYSPGSSAWAEEYPEVWPGAELPERRRRMLLRPSVGRRPPVIDPVAEGRPPT
jgi:hypothetical protein